MTNEQTIQYALSTPDPAYAELTNPEEEIAAKLTISQRTVDTHVQNILTKLNLRNRAQIAAWITSRSSSPQVT